MTLPDSDDTMLLLHNPRCSKSRATLALLEERGATFEVRPYLDDPLTPDELRSLAARLGKPPAEWVRSKEKQFTESGLTAASSEDELIAGIAAHPILMERPILVRGDRAVVGRPPEDVLSLL
jgi:arsenate reductase